MTESPDTKINGARVLLGEITGVHGVRGDLVVRSYTQSPDDVAAYGRLAAADGRPLPALTVVRATERGVIVRLAGVTDRTAAERYKGVQLWVDRAQLPTAAEEEFYHADLMGLAAVSTLGDVWGTVVAVENFGAGDLLEVRLLGTTATEFIPFTRASVPQIDLSARRATVLRVELAEDEPGAATTDDSGANDA